MDQCVVDGSKADFILMIGRQLLVLFMILFVITFGSLPVSFPLASFVPLVQDKMGVVENNKIKRG